MKNGRRLFGIAKTLGIAAAILAPSTLRADDTAGAPTFNKEVVRIFQNRCQDCHRTGIQFTPMGLMSYNEVRPWVKS
ncbi:hypothetical protein HYR69_06230, partial [Candidatus Sumerlaeota bacterium]|nr:hypothetical protein [Candidatus Sumerlaeota bacterium]